MLMRSHRALWLAPLVLVACAQPPDISAEIGSYADLLSDANYWACTCPQDLGFSSQTECDEVFGPVGTKERDCLAGALDGHEDAGQDYLTCVNAAHQDYVDCLELNLSCADGWYDDCTQDHDAAVAACPQLPSSVGAQFAACTD